MPCVRRHPMPSPSFPTPTPSPYIIIPHGIAPIPSPLHHPPHTPTQSPPTLYPHTIPPTPSPTLHHHHTSAQHHRPPARTRCSCPLWDMLSLPGVLWTAYSHQKPWCPIEYPGVAGKREGREPPTGWVQVGGAQDALCPASSHCPSWRAAHPAQDTSP